MPEHDFLKRQPSCDTCHFYESKDHPIFVSKVVGVILGEYPQLQTCHKRNVVLWDDMAEKWRGFMSHMLACDDFSEGTPVHYRPKDPTDVQR